MPVDLLNWEGKPANYERDGAPPIWSYAGIGVGSLAIVKNEFRELVYLLVTFR